jgi:HAD superfamily hydrolase (TIGR01549 family)
MNIKEPVKGIIFDLDGTLYRMPWYMKPLITLKLFPHCLRLPIYMSVRDKFAGKDMGTGEALMSALAQSLSKKIRGSTPARMRQWIYDDFYRCFESVMPLFTGSRPGLADTLAGLREKHVRLAVLSDFNRVAERLSKLEIDTSLFDIIEAAEKTGSLKPSPLPFTGIAETWGIPAEHILVIGDRHDTDGIAAEKAGMQFLQLNDKKKPPENAYTWRIIRETLRNIF